MSAVVTTVTWRFMRENLADIINRVRYSNERIAITRHGKVVAELGPPGVDQDQVSDARRIASMPVPMRGVTDLANR